MKRKPKQVTLTVIRGSVLGIEVYRGYAKLCDLATISKADIYDQKRNPTGTQRDLSPGHARDAYNYVITHDLAFWPEVFLCLRDNTVLKYLPSKQNKDIGKIIINIVSIFRDSKIKISRVDGNHRLHYADGKSAGFAPVKKKVSFCLAYNLNRKKEITLFRDINDNQRRMNTSHLDNIHSRLTPEAKLKREDPSLYIAEKLGKDPQSPFYNRVYQGGKKPPECFLPLRSLKTGIKNMFTTGTRLSALKDVDVQYKVVKTFFVSVKKWQPDAWKKPKKYLILRGATFWGICYIGSEVIDRVLGDGKFKSNDMLRVLKSGRDWDWTTSGQFKGYSGQGGAKTIRDMVVSEIEDSSGFSIKDLALKIMKE